jgi:hypothetical protein
MAIYYPECRINLSAVFDGFGGPDSPAVLPDIIPYSANVHLNSYKEADTWEVVFDAKRFPFSPELLRSAAVEVYLYLKPDQTSTPLWNTPENLMVTGLVDQATLTEDQDGGKVSLSGRDYTALMIDRQWDPTKSGKGGRIPDGNLQEVVQQLVDEATLAETTGRTLTVKLYDVDIEPELNKVNDTVTKNKVTIPKTTKSKTRKKRGVAVKADSTYWDVIYKLCLSYGFIVFVKGFDVVITKPHVLQNLAETNYRVAYGRNLERLEVERKLSKEATPQIRIRSYDPKTKTVIEGFYPSSEDIEAQSKGKGVGKKSKTLFGTTGVGVKKEEYKVFTVPDVKDKKTLDDIAKTTYYTLARGEGVIRFSTPHLRDLENTDLTRMRAGDSVEITWDAFNSEMMTSNKFTAEAKITTLLSLGYSYEVAALVAEQYSRLDYFRQPFYVKEVNITWDKDSGCKVDVEAMNFINPNASSGE